MPMHLPEPIGTAGNSHKDIANVAFILLAGAADERIVEKSVAMGAADDPVEDSHFARDLRTFQACQVVRANR